MPTVAVYDMTNTKVGDIELSEDIFGVEINEGLVHQAVVMQMASWRRGTHSTKTRADVRGGGRKPWRQKGTAVRSSVLTRAIIPSPCRVNSVVLRLNAFLPTSSTKAT